MPEGPEAKIASDYFNNFFKSSNNIKFELLTDYYQNKYGSVFNTLNENIKNYSESFTVGKNIFIEINEDLIFNFHLGMTGGWSAENVTHCHFKVTNENKELFFKDVRKFGKMKILTKKEFEIKFNSQIDILNRDYNKNIHLEFLNEKVKTKRSVCAIIMDQKFFPGVGNYIKSEVLYACKIHPEKKWSLLSNKKINNLLDELNKIMTHSYLSGGAELKDFKNPFDESDFKLKIYGKKETPLKKKVTSIITSDNRKTWFCKATQKL